MFAKTALRLFVLLVVILLFAQQVTAQSQGTPYTVTANSAINARQCPRLDCAIVTTLQPGTEINVTDTVTGDTVSNSDQWLQVDADGTEMYVHSALVAPSEVELQPVDSAGNEEEAELVDTSRWMRYRVSRFDVFAPRGWIDIAELATDEDYLSGVEEMYGAGERQWYLDTYAWVQDGSYDLVLVQIGSSGVLYVSHSDWGMPVSTRYLREVMETYMAASEGGEIISSEIVELSAGEAVRIEMTSTNVSGSTSAQYSYAIIVGDLVYCLDLVLFGIGIDEYYAALADAIANSFDYRASDL